jgi:hypothetical protein
MQLSQETLHPSMLGTELPILHPEFSSQEMDLRFNGVVVFGKGMMRVTFDNSTKRGNQMATEDYRDTRKKQC